MSKGGGAPCEPMAIHISCPTVSADVLLQLGTSFLEAGGRIYTPPTIRHFILQDKQIKQTKTHSVGVSPVKLHFAGKLTG